MRSLFSPAYLSRNPIEKAMVKFAKNFNENQKILDIGCGNKPYEKYFKCKYVGLDPLKETKADIIANAWEIPCKDNEFDGIILNQSLEHISKMNEAISELHRILKPGGLGIITAPQTMKNHSTPFDSAQEELSNFDKKTIKYWNNDYYRFTKFGLIYLFKRFRIIKIEETSGYASTVLQLINYFLYTSAGMLFFPIYFFNNILAIIFDKFFKSLSDSKISCFSKFYELVYKSLTLNYILVIKK